LTSLVNRGKSTLQPHHFHFLYPSFLFEMVTKHLDLPDHTQAYFTYLTLLTYMTQEQLGDKFKALLVHAIKVSFQGLHDKLWRKHFFSLPLEK